MPRVALTMIVRNEATNLAACLPALVPIADEMIVVDTGSTDDTKDVATRLGARVYDFPWCDDFAAARNHALSHATTDWIFWLDADDRIDDENVKKLASLFALLGNENVGYLMTIASAAEDGTTSLLAQHARLFRNDPTVRWEGRIHEQIVPAIERAGGALKDTDIIIAHVGYTDRDLVEKKNTRNLHLLDMELETKPFHPGLLFERGSTLLVLGRPAEALVALQLAAPAISSLGHHGARRVFPLMAQAHGALGQLGDALAVMRQARHQFPLDPDLMFYEARGVAACGDLRAAEAHLVQRELLKQALGAEAPREGLLVDLTVEIRAQDLLARLCAFQGRHAEAETHARGLIKLRPLSPDGWFTLGESLVAQSKEADLEALSGHLPTTDAELVHILWEAATQLRHDARRAVETILRAMEVWGHYPAVHCMYVRALVASAAKRPRIVSAIEDALAVSPFRFEVLCAARSLGFDAGRMLSPGHGMYRGFLA